MKWPGLHGAGRAAIPPASCAPPSPRHTAPDTPPVHSSSSPLSPDPVMFRSRPPPVVVRLLSRHQRGCSRFCAGAAGRRNRTRRGIWQDKRGAEHPRMAGASGRGAGGGGGGGRARRDGGLCEPDACARRAASLLAGMRSIYACQCAPLSARPSQPPCNATGSAGGGNHTQGPYIPSTPALPRSRSCSPARTRTRTGQGCRGVHTRWLWVPSSGR